jgi:hypothetical protein
MTGREVVAVMAEVGINPAVIHDLKEGRKDSHGLEQAFLSKVQMAEGEDAVNGRLDVGCEQTRLSRRDTEHRGTTQGVRTEHSKCSNQARGALIAKRLGNTQTKITDCERTNTVSDSSAVWCTIYVRCVNIKSSSRMYRVREEKTVENC